MTLAFLSEPAPSYGSPEQVTARLRRLVAPNPGPMTYHGTNTWLLETEAGTIVIDPGPDHAGHVAAVLAAVRTPISAILLTHTHPDHLGATASLRAASGAAVHGWHAPWQSGFTPDYALADGQSIAGLTALHTPGHASDHLCFAWDEGGLFSGDHVMSWNTSIVSPPDGDMAAYLASLRAVRARLDRVFYWGLGPGRPNPGPLRRAMRGHRLARETAIVAAMEDGLTTPEAIVARLYGDQPAHTRAAAARSVLAHMIKLRNDGVRAGGDVPSRPDAASISGAPLKQ